MKLIEFIRIIESPSDDHNHARVQAQTGFWGRAGAGAVIVARSTGRFLFPLRSADVNEPHTWGTWGGAIDQNEDPAEAARREVAEEAGYRGQMKIVPMYVFKDQRSGFQYFNFLAVVDDEFVPKLNWETEDYAWCEFGDWPEPYHPGLAQLLKDPKSREIMRRFADPK